MSRHVRIMDSDGYMPQWKGLTATVEFEEKYSGLTSILLDEGQERPDGRTTREFYWITDDLEDVDVEPQLILQGVTAKEVRRILHLAESRLEELDALSGSKRRTDLDSERDTLMKIMEQVAKS